MVQKTFRILKNKYVVDDNGKPLAPTNQNVPQLMAELTARKLSTEGRRDDLKKRVMVWALQCVSPLCSDDRAAALQASCFMWQCRCLRSTEEL